jgi:hypothetical protein
VFTRFHKPPYPYPYGRSVDETTTAWELLALRSSPAKCCRLSRDVPTPRPIRLAAAKQSPTGVRLLGTCSLGIWARAPLVRTPQCHVQSALAPTTLCGHHGGCLIFTRSWHTTKGSVASSSWVKYAIDPSLPLLNWEPLLRQSTGRPLLFLL